MNSFAKFLFHQPRRYLALVGIVSLLTGLLNASLIAAIGEQLKGVDGTDYQLTSLFIWTFFGLVVLIVINELLSKWLLVKLSAKVAYDLRVGLCRFVRNNSVKSTEQIGAPRLTAAFAEDVHLTTSAMNQIPNLAISSAIILGCSIYLLWLSWTTFIALSLFAIPIIAGTYWIHMTGSKHLNTLLNIRDKQIGLFTSLLEGVKELKLSNARWADFYEKEVIGTARKSTKAYVLMHMTYALSNTWTQSALFLLLLSLLVFIYAGFSDASLLATYAVIAIFLKSHVTALVRVLPAFSRAGLALERMARLGFDAREDEAVAYSLAYEAAVDAADVKLVVNGLRHNYLRESDDSSFELGPVDLEFQSPQLVFVFGANGSGKTTLIKLLSGLYVSETGDITINGVPVDNESIDWYRQHFAILFTNPFVSSVLHGLSHPDLGERAAAYLRKLNLDHKVTVTNGRISSINLSHGQRKRLALLVAYLEDKPIYIFDEWAENQDPEFKKVFYEDLLPELRSRGKIVIVITHEEQYAHICDRIIRLDNGKVVSDLATASTITSRAINPRTIKQGFDDVRIG